MPSHSNTVVETPFSQEKNPSDDYPQKFVLRVVGAIAIAHLLNDSIQAVVTASYPMLKAEFSLSFAQIGWIALVYQITASLLQPWIGLYTDKHPKPYLLPAGMGVTLVGIGLIAIASNFQSLLIAAALIGVGSSTFHPEASRIARTASGGRFGTAQSMFQVGGNTGSALGPLVAAAVIIPNGQGAIGLFVVVAALAIFVLLRVTKWLLQQAPVQGVATITNYFTFYLIERFNVSIQTSQLYLFIFLGAVALGTFVGGPVGDRIGRKAVVWVSFLGVAPFALMLPYVGLTGTAVLTVIIGLVMSSAFSALVVYAQEAVPGRVGMIAGLMFGLMFGIGGVGAAGLGHLADTHGIVWVYKLCSFLPLLGFMTALLPNTQQK
ncbi:hypothetical protein FQR65_LT19194 [Abscondita terminalis]|nr:hypothetical protein FQR65_LT19194 [Abscondita terminalis]